MSPRLLTPAEAARLLNVPETTMRRWIRQGLFLGAGPDGEGIERAELDRWAARHGLRRGPRGAPAAAPPTDLLSDAVARGAVVAGAEPATAAAAIALAVDAVPGLDQEARAGLCAEVLERERMASTGLGHGVALPHPRRPPGDLFPAPVISACFPRTPLDWAALDGEPVHAVLLVLSPSAPVHLEILSRVAFVLRSPESRELLRRSPSHAELVAHLRAIRKER
ncbi:MAG: PTS sugar transporter subunit IIA [Planctomycetota bacterium]